LGRRVPLLQPTSRVSLCSERMAPSWHHGRASWDTLKPHTTTGHYVNDLVETGESTVRAAYVAATYDWLVALKREFDPDNVFRMNQNVKP
jgi:hypothetical protein